MDTKTLPDHPFAALKDLPGQSPPMLALRAAIARLAHQQAPVLIHGETGTGKERVARSLHRQAGGADAQFRPIHATALEPASLREIPPGATLFIDAVQELSAEAQSGLLRYLQATPAPARLMTASHADGAALAAAGALRADLVNRLAALQLAMPSLRDRREDLPELVSLLVAELAPGRDLRLSDAAATAVVLHGWPGNVRELRNRLAQAVLLADGAELTPDMLGLAAPGRPNSLSLREMRQAAEREAITRALRQSHGQVPLAASMLGISRAQLYRLISRLKLDHHALLEGVALPAPAPKADVARAVAEPVVDPARTVMS